ncbi:MAG: glycine/sarcosine/betaine reductase selenoprotein B family protein [Anaerolineaceae bacterium]|nr:glycine/sarcosine/betaine reductase selenoprotein B family protein [Anaerolineaceae bacterium]
MQVDSFRYVSSLITRYYKLSSVKKELPIPWTPLARPVNRSIFGLVTTGGLYHLGQEAPFDLERERQNPPWGDPSFRTLPMDMNPSEVGVSHFHINTCDIVEDMNILMPVQRMHELAAERRVGGLAPHAYSFMGYQGFPADLSGWKDTYGPQVAEKLRSEGVDCVLLSTA